MTYGLVVTLIAVGELLIIGLLIFIIVMMVKNRRREKIQAFNDRQASVEVFKKKIREKGEAVEKAIKESSSTDDYINIYNDIMQDVSGIR